MTVNFQSIYPSFLKKTIIYSYFLSLTTWQFLFVCFWSVHLFLLLSRLKFYILSVIKSTNNNILLRFLIQFMHLFTIPDFAKSVRIRSLSGPYLPAFVLNTERYGVPLRIQSECGKIRT